MTIGVTKSTETITFTTYPVGDESDFLHYPDGNALDKPMYFDGGAAIRGPDAPCIQLGTGYHQCLLRPGFQGGSAVRSQIKTQPTWWPPKRWSHPCE